MDNYKRIINYVQNPFSKELVLNSLSMSEFGKIHFFEVKRIFIGLYVISIVFIGIIIFKIITNKDNELGKKLIKSFNNSTNIIIAIFISVTVASAIDFSKAFYIFHKIFFRNDYWVFDPRVDPIINALPEEFFMIELILIVAVLIIFTLVIKALNLEIFSKKKI
jgi:integral membrane protein (TIGR01906 family)